jgi:hypothetical protein
VRALTRRPATTKLPATVEIITSDLTVPESLDATLQNVGAIFLLGWLGMAIAGAPIVLAGLLVAALSGAMPRRTASGREMFRRSLGFRRYMTVAETERQRFAEDANIFSEYLPCHRHGLHREVGRAFRAWNRSGTSDGQAAE